MRRVYVWLPSQAAFVRRDAIVAAGGWRRELDWLSDWFAIYAAAFRHGVWLLDGVEATVTEHGKSYGKTAAEDAARRAAGLDAMFDALQLPEFESMRRAMRAGPYALLQPFESAGLARLARRPGDWDLAAALFTARAIRFLRRKLGG
jgi:hypothetical protein